MELAVRCQNLQKRYGDVVAVDGLSIEVRRGECYGLLGPNGAGKTTTIEILEGLLAPDGGDVEVLGHYWKTDEQQLRQRLGVQLQETQFTDKLTVEETLRLFRSFYDRGKTVEELLALVELESKRRSWVVKLSGGQKQRLSIACALAGDPDLLFLDEPTTGLDPQSRRQLWGILTRFREAGGTVLLTTHYMDEAQNLANRVAVIAHGTIVAEGPPGSLAGRDRMKTRIRFRLPPGAPEPERAPHRLPDGSYEIRADQEETTKLVHDLTAWALESGFVLDALEVTPPTLEDVYLELTASEDVTA